MTSPTRPQTRLTVLISGSGTNLQALIDALPSTLSHCSIVRVISNRKSAYGLTRASNAQIPTSYHNLVAYKKKYPSSIDTARREYDADLATLILQDSPHVIVCAGWMHILSETFLEPLHAQGVCIINLHPALPGAYNGANAIERAHKDFVEGRSDGRTGIMVHHVIGEVDMGEPIVVREIMFEEGDRELSVLEERIHRVEWEAIVEGTRLAVEGYWEVRAKRESGGA